MVKKRKKMFSILLILSLFVLTLNVHAAEKGDLRCPVITGIDTEKNVNCQEVETGGVVTEAIVTYGDDDLQPGDIQIRKHVKKTSTLGKYEIYFEVRGNIEKVKVPQKAYISVIIDMSATIRGKIKKVKEAAKGFASALNAGNYYISLHQFGTYDKLRRSLDNKDFSDVSFLDYDKGGMGHKSFVDRAFKAVYNELRNVNGKKYVVLIGDGYYWYERDTGVNAAKNYAKKLRNELGVDFYIVRYASSEDGQKNEWRSQANHANCYKSKKSVCNKNMMMNFMCGKWNCEKVLEDYADRYNDKGQWTVLADKFADSIKKKTDGLFASSTLTDNLGVDFSFADSDNSGYNNLMFSISEITKEWKSTSPFEVVIDTDTSDGWDHPTNQNFKLSYITKDEGGNTVEKEITVSKSPEVYWVGDKNEYGSCIGTLQKTSTNSDNDVSRYWKQSCSEGYLNDKKKNVSGLKIDLNIKSYDFKKKDYVSVTQNKKNKTTPPFETNNLGLKVDMNLSTNVKCTLTFDWESFIQDYDGNQDTINYFNNIISYIETGQYTAAFSEESIQEMIDIHDWGNEQLSQEEKLKIVMEEQKKFYNDQIEIMEDDILTMEQTLNSYLGKLDYNLDDYVESFKKQTAKISFAYNDQTNEETLLESSDTKVTYSTPTTKTISINDINTKKFPKESVAPYQEIYNKLFKSDKFVIEKNISLSMSKTLSFPYSCLAMKTGNQEVCNDENNQLTVGNVFYPPVNVTSGKISILLENAGIRGRLNFSLNGDNCQFTQQRTMNVTYRQIDVADPFIQDYNNGRKIGENYLNNTLKAGAKYKYNFVGIIHEDTWTNPNNLFEYRYLMSKQNIANIRKDSDEEGASSYLGRNCHFNSDNKYICDFTRNQVNGSGNSSQEWFTGVNINS